MLDVHGGRITWWFWLALLLQLGAGFFYMVSGLLVPQWPLMLLWLVWIALTVLLVTWRGRGTRTLWVPVLATGFWFAYIYLGEVLFGWTG
jgi:hypothetical protein